MLKKKLAYSRFFSEKNGRSHYSYCIKGAHLTFLFALGDLSYLTEDMGAGY